MSSTRRTSKSGTIRQERFASSASLPKGLLGNHIARRCAALREPSERNLVHFLHELSLRDGFTLHRTCKLFPAWPWPSTGTVPAERAFERVARELAEMFPDRIGARHVERFRKLLPRFLVKLCLDPAAEPRAVEMPNFAGIAEALHEYKRRFEAAGTGKLASTVVSRTIFETLDYALTVRGIALVLGTYRAGKSFSTQAWAQMHLGEARYVQLSSAFDDGSFYRDIARSLGVACGVQMKAAAIRLRVEEVLRSQHLLLILDECEYLLPQSVNLRAAPERLNWLMTSVVNNGVSVALIGSKNISRMLAHVEKKAVNWGSEQFHGRIKIRRELPDSLEPEDLKAIADVLLPDSDDAARLLLVSHALRSQGYVASLESGASRASFFAGQDGGAVAYGHVRRVMEEAGTAEAAEAAQTRDGRRSRGRRGNTATRQRIARKRPETTRGASRRNRFHRHTAARNSPVMRPGLAR